MNSQTQKKPMSRVPHLTVSNIESIARDVIHSFSQGADLEPNAVNIERLAEKHLGIRLDYAHLSNNGSILGMMIFQDCSVPLYLPNEKTIKIFEAKAGTAMIEHSLTEDRNRGRIRFTIAHECAHWILHRPTLKVVPKRPSLNLQQTSDQEDLAIVCRKVTTKPKLPGERTAMDWKEWQADNLASALLMPSAAVHTFMKDYTRRLSEKTKFMFADYGEQYVQAQTSSLLRQLAALFQVSERTAEIRLNRLGFLYPRTDVPEQRPSLDLENNFEQDFFLW